MLVGPPPPLALAFALAANRPDPLRWPVQVVLPDLLATVGFPAPSFALWRSKPGFHDVAPGATGTLVAKVPTDEEINMRMGHTWIDEGLRQAADRERQAALAAERQRHREAVIKQQAPDLMVRLASAIGAAVDEYKEKARVGSDKIDFEPLPRESFRVTKVTLPSINLECHPDYDGHVVYCNMARSDSHESGACELEFALQVIADGLGNLELRDGNRSFANVDDVAEFLLKPVLFPLPSETP